MEKNLISEVDKFIKSILPEIIKIRQELHCFPELSWKEANTSKTVSKYLDHLKNITVKDNIADHGVTALLKGPLEGKTIGLRADMDALPIRELSGHSYQSQIDGVHHACGHDGHMACLLGAAKVLDHFKNHLKGQIKFIFQPAEELGEGAEAMIASKVLKDPSVEKIFGLHGIPQIEVGKVGTRSKAIMAATDEFDVKIIGKGGHAAYPEHLIDPIVIASQAINALQTISSRFVSPTDPVVLSVTRIQAGNSYNIIPSEIAFSGTIRTTSPKIREACLRQMNEILVNMTAAYGAKVEIKIQKSDPATLNHHQSVQLIKEVTHSFIGKESFIPIENPSMGGEDFAYYLNKVPGAFFFLGLKPKNKDESPSLHHPQFDFNDDALEYGIKILVGIALKGTQFFKTIEIEGKCHD